MAARWPWTPAPTFLRNRTFQPFHEDEPFASLSDLGRFQWIRDCKDQERFGYTGGPALVDPTSGWIVQEPARLLRHGRIDIHTVSPPNFLGYCRSRCRHQAVHDVGEIISLRDAAEVNYYHFLIDIIGGRLRLADELGLFPNVPILVGRRVFEERRYCREVIRLMEIPDDLIVIQDDRPASAWWARSERLYFAHTPQRSQENLHYLRRALRVPDSNPAASRRIFLIREQRYGRGIRNLEAVVQVANHFGFEIIGTAEKSIEQQREIFSDARYVVGIHGAGLTNLIFRKNAPCSLLEIFPPWVTHPRTHYYYISRVLGFNHDLLLDSSVSSERLSGRAFDYKGNFDIDIDNLTAALRRMLDNT
jgi:capsular polysaccharide biosynthesis protein